MVGPWSPCRARSTPARRLGSTNSSRKCHTAVSANVDLDIARLEFMDSSGLSVVVAEHKRAKADGGGLVIHHPSRRVIRLFQTHGLMSYLVVQPRMST